MLTGDLDAAARYVAAGYSFLALGSDAGALAAVRIPRPRLSPFAFVEMQYFFNQKPIQDFSSRIVLSFCFSALDESTHFFLCSLVLRF